jgi:natural resistance-associated macrophage protein
MGLVLQLLAARLGVVTGKNLAEHCRERYNIYVSYTLWVMTELAIIGSDIQEVVGSAIAINILSHGKIPLYGGALITVADTFTFLILEKYGIRKLEALFASLIAIMAISFGVEYVISDPDEIKVLVGVVVPDVDSRTLGVAVGLLGAILMPHNIYLHSALVQSRNINKQDKKEIQEANKYYAIESAIALFISFVINLFVVVVFARGFYGVPDADSIGLETAGTYLRDKYGEFSQYIWAIGLLAAGQSSTMTGTYAGQFVMEGFLQFKIPRWKRLLITRSVAIVPAVIVAIVAHGHLDSLDEWLNVLQSVQLPFALLPVLLFTSDTRIMGTFTNGLWVRTIVVMLSLFVIGVNIYFVLSFLLTSVPSTVTYVLLAFGGLFYSAFLGYLLLKVLMTFRASARSAEYRIVINQE